MNKVKVIRFTYFIPLIVVLVSFNFGEPLSAQEKGKESDWSKAGKEISEAARAVGEASQKTWDKTRNTTSEAWEKARSNSAKVLKKTRKTSDDVAEKSEEVIESAVHSSKSGWQKTRETTSRWYATAKKKIHDLISSPE